MRITTKRGYDFFEAASAMQKAIRRNDAKIAGFFALELFHSGYQYYVWRRLLVISAEDCYGIGITTEVFNLYRAYVLVHENKSEDDMKGRVFLSKALLILCRTKKCRDADHLHNLMFDQGKGITDEEALAAIKIDHGEIIDVPDYAHDVHTKRGRYLGKTKEDFFREEFIALEPREKGLFDGLIDG